MSEENWMKRPKLMYTKGFLSSPLAEMKPKLALVSNQSMAAPHVALPRRMWHVVKGPHPEDGFGEASAFAGSAESSSQAVVGPMIVKLPMAHPEGTAYERAMFFASLGAKQPQERVQEREARTFADLMLIRSCNSKHLQQYSNILGSGLGLKTRKGVLTTQPAILIYVTRKIGEVWLGSEQTLPNRLWGPEGLWSSIDVVEFADDISQQSEAFSGLADNLRGCATRVGPGSQVSTSELYGTLGAIVSCRKQNLLGFLASRHVSVDLDQPVQGLYHPQHPIVGPGVYLGAVDRALSFATDHLWYGQFCSPKPASFVRADCAFIPFADGFDQRLLTPEVIGLGRLGPLVKVDLEMRVGDLVGREVQKVGRSTGLTTGVIMAYAIEHSDGKGNTIYTDFLILGAEGQSFDAEGDSGSLLLLKGEGTSISRPLGILWGGTGNHGRLRLRGDNKPDAWTSGIGLSRLLDLLDLDLVTSLDQPEGKQEEA